MKLGTNQSIERASKQKQRVTLRIQTRNIYSLNTPNILIKAMEASPDELRDYQEKKDPMKKTLVIN